MSSPSPFTTYFSQAFWAKRYSEVLSEDWYDPPQTFFSSLRKLLKEFCPDRPLHVLHVGCGVSSFCHKLHHVLPDLSVVVNLDYCPEAIKQASLACPEASQKRTFFVIGDVTKLDDVSWHHPPEGRLPEFDVIFDKACFDGLSPPDAVEMFRAIERSVGLLKPVTGIYLCISHCPLIHLSQTASKAATGLQRKLKVVRQVTTKIDDLSIYVLKLSS
jgi:hypothetical protein